MTSNEPTRPDPDPSATQQSGAQPPPQEPPPSYPPPQDPTVTYPQQPGPGGPPQYPPPQQQPPQHQPPQQPPTYPPPQQQPPQQPPTYQPTQAVPSYTPPSASDPYAQSASFQAPQQGGGSSGGGGGQRAILAGVLGGLVLLAAAVGGVLFFMSGDEPSADPGSTTTTTEVEVEDTTTSTTEAVEDRIGTSVEGIGLLTGDCINFEAVGSTVETFDIVACGTPHLAEIAGQIEHPDAGAGFPGVGAMQAFANGPCNEMATEFVGVDPVKTSLISSPLVPDFDEWGEGLYTVSCLIQSNDGARLIESVANRGSSYPRASEVTVRNLQPGDCFVPTGSQGAFDLGTNDVTMLTSCVEPHDGLLFGRAEVSAGSSDPFPGDETLEAEGIELCDALFVAYFGVAVDGFNYRYWVPIASEWNTGDRSVHCAILDEKGLPSTLDFAAFQQMYLLPIGSCFLFGPEESSDQLRLDDAVEVVDCSLAHNGELFGFGELAKDTDAFPGQETVDADVQQICIERFEQYVGISPFDSASGDFLYWFPNETGWGNNDLRWLCALVTDETRTGTIADTNA